MTQEEKARAYDEALERAQKVTRAGSDVAMDIVQYIFPELAESEDERIIKLIRSLLENVRNVQSNTSLYKQYDDALAWLEKQKIFSKNGEGCYYYHADGSYTFIGSMGFGPIEDIKLNGERPKTKNKGVDLPGACLCVEKQKDLTTENIYKHSRERMSFWNGQQKEQKPVSNPKWAELTWKDINELERIINNVHYEFQNGIGEDSFGELVLERFKEYKDDGSMDEQKPAEPSGKLSREEYLYQLLIDQLITYSDYEYLTGKNPAWSEEDEKMLENIRYALRYAFDKQTAEYVMTWLKSLPERFNLQPKSEWAEEEKTRFVSGQFLQCKLSFDGFKEGEHYWLEYVGDDMYVGRSDNILNQKFHITPRQLYTLFSQQLEEVQGPPQEEKQVSLNYEPPFNENPSDREIIEALIKDLKEQDGFLTAIDCVSTKAILSWLEKHLNNNSLI